MTAWLLALFVTGSDYRMAVAQEASIRSFRPLDPPTMFLPAAHAGLIRQLGCDLYATREAASRTIEAMPGDAPLRLLLWAAMSRDMETRNRAERIIAGRFRCEVCRGVGRCPGARGNGYSPCSICGAYGPDEDHACPRCLGDGERR